MTLTGCWAPDTGRMSPNESSDALPSFKGVTRCSKLPGMFFFVFGRVSETLSAVRCLRHNMTMYTTFESYTLYIIEWNRHTLHFAR